MFFLLPSHLSNFGTKVVATENIKKGTTVSFTRENLFIITLGKESDTINKIPKFILHDLMKRAPGMYFYPPYGAVPKNNNGSTSLLFANPPVEYANAMITKWCIEEETCIQVMIVDNVNAGDEIFLLSYGMTGNPCVFYVPHSSHDILAQSSENVKKFYNHVYETNGNLTNAFNKLESHGPNHIEHVVVKPPNCNWTDYVSDCKEIKFGLEESNVYKLFINDDGRIKCIQERDHNTQPYERILLLNKENQITIYENQNSIFKTRVEKHAYVISFMKRFPGLMLLRHSTTCYLNINCTSRYYIFFVPPPADKATILINLTVKQYEINIEQFNAPGKHEEVTAYIESVIPPYFIPSKYYLFLSYGMEMENEIKKNKGEIKNYVTLLNGVEWC